MDRRKIRISTHIKVVRYLMGGTALLRLSGHEKSAHPSRKLLLGCLYNTNRFLVKHTETMNSEDDMDMPMSGDGEMSGDEHDVEPRWEPGSNGVLIEEKAFGTCSRDSHAGDAFGCEQFEATQQPLQLLIGRCVE